MPLVESTHSLQYRLSILGFLPCHLERSIKGKMYDYYHSQDTICLGRVLDPGEYYLVRQVGDALDIAAPRSDKEET